MISGSLEIEISNRLSNLYTNHHDWLRAVAYNLSKSHQLSDDMVQELYLYLAEKQNPKLFFNDSFNLKYCHSFLSSRYINWIKRENKKIYVEKWKDVEDEEYDHDYDESIDKAFDDVIKELERLKTTPMWSSAKLYEMYQFSDKTMEKLSKDIGISKSTTFLNVKKIKEHLKNNIKNPNDERE